MLIVGDTNFMRIDIQDLFDMDNGQTFCYNITADDGFQKVVVQGFLRLPTTETDPLILLYIIIALVVIVIAAVHAVLGIIVAIIKHREKE
jgi:hypothetical protein